MPTTSYVGRAKMLSSTAARYLPIYVHIGSQHQLHALPGEPPLRPESLQDSAEDAETVVALAQQDAVSGAASTSQDASGLLEQQQAPGNNWYSGLGVPAYRSYFNVLSYHRMFAIRQRAAALCAAAVGRDWPTPRREPARPAELCDNIAPRLEVAAASGRVPPSPPQPPIPAPVHPGRTQGSRSVLERINAYLCMGKYFHIGPGACWFLSPGVETLPGHPVVSAECGSNL